MQLLVSASVFCLASCPDDWVGYSREIKTTKTRNISLCVEKVLKANSKVEKAKKEDGIEGRIVYRFQAEEQRPCSLGRLCEYKGFVSIQHDRQAIVIGCSRDYGGLEMKKTEYEGRKAVVESIAGEVKSRCLK